MWKIKTGRYGLYFELERGPSVVRLTKKDVERLMAYYSSFNPTEFPALEQALKKAGH